MKKTPEDVKIQVWIYFVIVSSETFETQLQLANYVNIRLC